ncbi:MAG: hypothetical protein JO296_10655 [Pseudonocardiales bacterium]|nr:hypothetical protein [Pseudonocardiales bacterium]
MNFGGRVPESLRRRARFFAVAHDVDLQDVIAQALAEYLARHETPQQEHEMPQRERSE